MLLTVSDVMKHYGIKRNQVMKLVNAKDSKWKRFSEKGMWLVEEVDLMKQIEARKRRAKR